MPKQSIKTENAHLGIISIDYNQIHKIYLKNIIEYSILLYSHQNISIIHIILNKLNATNLLSILSLSLKDLLDFRRKASWLLAPFLKEICV